MPREQATVLSWASAHTQASAHPPILTVCGFFKVLRVASHHAKIFVVNPKEGRSLAVIVVMHFGRHEIRHQRFAHIHPWPVLPLSTAETRLQVGPLCSTIQLF